MSRPALHSAHAHEGMDPGSFSSGESYLSVSLLRKCCRIHNYIILAGHDLHTFIL